MTSKPSRARLGDSLDAQHRTVSRSPHPYHRRGPSLATPEFGDDHNALSSELDSSRRPTPKLSSESGTEADDEGGHSLKSLPAPPLRASKGLRNVDRGRGVEPTPLPTPGLEEDRQLSGPFGSSVAASFDGSKENVESERRQIREKYTKRRRAEIIRRLTEVGLFCSVGSVVCFRSDVLARLREWHQGNAVLVRLWQSRANSTELESFLITPLCLYLLYPVRLLVRARSHVTLPRITGLHLPSSFDPAPLIYPIYLPFLVASSLAAHSPKFLLPNMILGLSSLPPPCIPLFERVFSYSHVQWLLAILPLVLSQNSLSKTMPARPLALKAPTEGSLSPEMLSILYPLQQCLVPTIQYLTTTSLDASEQELLSTVLLNLYLFAQSPQIQILKSLMWIGSLGLFLLCSQVLEWEVALARLPAWRLRRNERKSKKSLLTWIDALVCGRVARTRSRAGRDGSSDEEIETTYGTTSSAAPDRSSLSLDVRRNSSTVKSKEPVSAIEKVQNHDGVNGDSAFTRTRRHTFSTLADSVPSPAPRTTSKGRPKRTITPALQSFLSFTPSQALVRKWLYAAYAYLATSLLILFPIRHLVRIKALHGVEPFGWAIGYLLGDIPIARFWIVNHNLEPWIPLPPLKDSERSQFCRNGWVERLRQDLGEANTRLLLCAYCVCVLTTGIALVLRLTSVVEVDTRRKVFHGIMVAMLSPSIYIDPCFVALALALILSIFLLLDLFRASQLPPISKPLTYFLAPYVDGRDHRGPVIVSHIFLLIGCAIPLWLSMAGAQRTGNGAWEGWDVKSREVSMVSGVICVGLGDAAASLIGRRFGRHKWLWAGGKSLEGSMAFTVAVTTGLLAAYTWLVVGGWTSHQQSWPTVLAKSVLAASGASLTEAVLTGANDNVVVPVVLWLLVRGLRI